MIWKHNQTLNNGCSNSCLQYWHTTWYDDVRWWLGWAKMLFNKFPLLNTDMQTEDWHLWKDACDHLGGASLPNFNQIFKGWEDWLTLKGPWNCQCKNVWNSNQKDWNESWWLFSPFYVFNDQSLMAVGTTFLVIDMAVYTTSSVLCGWAGAVVSLCKLWKSKMRKKIDVTHWLRS